MEKKWKTVNYWGLEYRVSNYGDVISASTGRTIKHRLNADGYPTVTLGHYTKRRGKTIHSIVADNFIEKPEDSDYVEYEINHKDFNRENCMEDNLEWATHLENIRHSTESGRYKERDFNGENNPNFGNDTLKRKYAENPELAKKNNSRPGSKNGRCVPVEAFKDGVSLGKFKYKGECADFLSRNGYVKAKHTQGVADRITKSIKNNEPYCGLTFKVI